MLSKRRNLAAFGLESGQFDQVKLMSDDLKFMVFAMQLFSTAIAFFRLNLNCLALVRHEHRIQLAAYGLLIEFRWA